MGSERNQPDSRTGIFGVIRIDFFTDTEVIIERDPASWGRALWGQPSPTPLTGVKALGSIEEAHAEVARLNRVNRGKGCVYFAVHLRVPKGGLPRS